MQSSQNTGIVPCHPETQEVVITPIELPPIEEVLSGQLSESSIKMYRRDVRAYSAYCKEQGYNPTDVQSLKSWRDHLYRESDKSPHTINRMIATVKYIIREMAEHGLIDESITVKFDRVHVTNP